MTSFSATRICVTGVSGQLPNTAARTSAGRTTFPFVTVASLGTLSPSNVHHLTALSWIVYSSHSVTGVFFLQSASSVWAVTEHLVARRFIIITCRLFG